MDSFTVVDGIVAAVVVVSALLAYSRGIVRETMAIVGWVAAAVVAFTFAAPAGDVVGNLPVVGDQIDGSCELKIIAGFAVAFAIALAVVSFFTPLLSTVVRKTALDSIDQILGFLFGVARGIVLVAVAFFLYNTILSSQGIAAVDNSRAAAVFNDTTDDIQDQDPSAALEWLTARYNELLLTCVAE
ncbi:CvpA family protein [Marivivens donghaensis]|uniref:CvpA family protein n=1 Tax=Marivivens donghaensis TaxID=1699413 RepID=A0ABX0VWZ7_9RHOB|nr:CvpA family protein [Marivivens donghaensis]NIY72590.1 CvpA family protein [Marivivens donghaensis]